jgi:hypothetical protein
VRIAIMVFSAKPGFSLVGGAQFKAHHIAAAIEVAAVEHQHAVAVVDARARLGRRDQPPQHRRDALGIDREIDVAEGFVARAVSLAGFEIEQPLRVDGDGVGLDGGRSRDRAGNDFGLHQQALRARIDQSGAELRQIENAREHREQADQVERRQCGASDWKRSARRDSGRRA